MFLIFASVSARMLISKSWRLMIEHFVIFPSLIFLVWHSSRSVNNECTVLIDSFTSLPFFIYLSLDFKRDMLALIDEKMDM